MEIIHSLLFAMMKLVEEDMPRYISVAFEKRGGRNMFAVMLEEMTITGSRFDIARMIQALIMLAWGPIEKKSNRITNNELY